MEDKKSSSSKEYDKFLRSNIKKIFKDKKQ